MRVKLLIFLFTLQENLDVKVVNLSQGNLRIKLCLPFQNFLAAILEIHRLARGLGKIH